MLGVAFTYGVTLGFEFVDENFEGGGWVLHLIFFKVMYFKNVNLEDFDE